MSTTAISIRLDSEIKKQFDALCKAFGISTNAAFNLFAKTVVREKAIPFRDADESGLWDFAAATNTLVSITAYIIIMVSSFCA